MPCATCRRPGALRLGGRPVERGDLLRPEVLAERVRVREGIDVGEHLEVAAVDEHRVVARLEQRQPQLVEAPDRFGRERETT